MLTIRFTENETFRETKYVFIDFVADSLMIIYTYLCEIYNLNKKNELFFLCVCIILGFYKIRTESWCYLRERKPV